MSDWFYITSKGSALRIHENELTCTGWKTDKDGQLWLSVTAELPWARVPITGIDALKLIAAEDL